MVRNLVVSIPPSLVAQLISDAVAAQPGAVAPIFGPRGGRLLDDCRIETGCGTYICQVYSAYYARVGSFVTLIVTIADTSGATSVHVTTGGHRKLFESSQNDLGASASFIGLVEKALADHVTSGADK